VFRPFLRFLPALLIAVPLAAQRPLNLDFERASVSYADRPWGWSLGWSAFGGGPAATFALDSVVRVQGKWSLRITATDTAADPPARAMQLQVPAGFARGKTLRLTGKLRARGSGSGIVTLEAWGDRVVTAGDTATATTDRWSSFDLTIQVGTDPSIHSITFLVGAVGNVTAWIDGMALTVNGAPMTALPVEAPAPTRAELRWLAGRSAPFAEVLPAGAAIGKDTAAFRIFDAVVGDARAVGLGESTHGTREFFQMKHRLVRHLVEDLGFTLFAVEANQMAVRRLDAYVMGDTGTTRKAMRVMFRVWNTEEMEALVDWIRDWNRTHPARPVRFIGYDMQDHQIPITVLREFVATAELAMLPRVEALTRDYTAQQYYATPQVAESIRTIWGLQGDSLVREVRAHRGAWLARATTAADSLKVEWAVQGAELYAQAAGFNVALYSPTRDSLMAANLDWALHTLYPTARAAVWAHDVHVSHGGDRQRSFNAGAQMGAHLLHTYGIDYRAFSLLTGTGTYSATRSFTDHVIATVADFPAPPGSVEAALGALPRPRDTAGLIADLRVNERDPAGAWLWKLRPIRSIGYAAYDYGFDLTAAMPLEFDGVIYLEPTTASRLLP
jgi:erythromycin esterase